MWFMEPSFYKLIKVAEVPKRGFLSLPVHVQPEHIHSFEILGNSSRGEKKNA